MGRNCIIIQTGYIHRWNNGGLQKGLNLGYRARGRNVVEKCTAIGNVLYSKVRDEEGKCGAQRLYSKGKRLCR